jgi:hypothetical protein
MEGSRFATELARITDGEGHPKTGFFDPATVLPDQAHDEPFAAAMAASPAGVRIADPSAFLSQREHARFDREIAQLEYASGRGPKPEGRIGRLITRFFNN